MSSSRVAISDQMVLLTDFTSASQRRFNDRSRSIQTSLNSRMKKAGFSGSISLLACRTILAAAVMRPCLYCGEIIKVATMSADHAMPIARGGEPFEIVCCCTQCNRRKGELSEDEYRALMAFVGSLAPEAQASIWRRLAAGGSFFRMHRAMDGMAQQLKQAKNGGVKP